MRRNGHRRCRMTSGGKEEGSRRNEHTNMPAYNDGEMDEEKDEEKDGEKDALAELAHTEQRKRPK